MITLSLLAIMAAALFQPSTPRAMAALIFAGAVVLHDGLLRNADGFAYYASAATFDWAVLWAIGKIDPLPRLAVDLQGLCLLSILANCVGYGLWYTYAPPGLYDFAIFVVNVGAVIALTRRDGEHVGHTAMGGRLTGVCGYRVARAGRSSTDKG